MKSGRTHSGRKHLCVERDKYNDHPVNLDPNSRWWYKPKVQVQKAHVSIGALIAPSQDRIAPAATPPLMGKLLCKGILLARALIRLREGIRYDIRALRDEGRLPS